jgi:hypothetical protein
LTVALHTNREIDTTWNALAKAAHDAGAWIETPEEMVQRQGVVNHVHVDFGRAANNNYGTCVDSQLP